MRKNQSREGGGAMVVELLFGRRWSFVNMLSVGVASIGIIEKHWITAAIVLVIGAVLATAGELWLEKEPK
jgi:hypothetical protein